MFEHKYLFFLLLKKQQKQNKKTPTCYFNYTAFQGESSIIFDLHHSRWTSKHYLADVVRIKVQFVLHRNGWQEYPSQGYFLLLYLEYISKPVRFSFTWEKLLNQYSYLLHQPFLVFLFLTSAFTHMHRQGQIQSWSLYNLLQEHV